MTSLVLTLGHNSSAILIENGDIIAGYEEERLSGEKSDSRFPIMAIRKLIQIYGNKLPDDINICVSHWFLEGCLPDWDNKYWNRSILNELFPKATYYDLNTTTITHHDAHALSAQVFAGKDFPEEYHLLVADGFGTEGECITLYEQKPNQSLNCLWHIYGFLKSMGLLYQYATDFCGMKMHQHEYKMLAYETHIMELLNRHDLEVINNLIDQRIHIFLEDLFDLSEKERSLKPLELTKHLTHFLLIAYISNIKHLCGVTPQNERDVRILVAYFVQRVVEGVIGKIIQQANVKNLMVVGGLFYNVKLNSLLCDMTPGKFCVMPLAGDQGAGLGVYQHYFKDLKWPGHLFWGTRDLNFESSVNDVIKSLVLTRELIAENLYNDEIVNLVRGDMEFGPRTLCNTSTLARPTLQNAALINEMNNRTNEMPFALVVTETQARDLFEDIDKVHKSLEYMIITRQFKPGKHVGLEGGAHHYPIQGIYTCRPQITRDSMMVDLLEEFGPLINTSFNYHGQPIVYDQQSIEEAHTNEQIRYPIVTIVEES